MDSTKASLLARFQETAGTGFARAMNMELLEMSGERVVIGLVVGPEHLQPFGLVHGGVLAGIVETACSIGASFNTGEGTIVVGVENHTSFLRSVRQGRLTATAGPLHVGRRSQLWETRIENEERKLVATGRLRLLSVEASG